MMSSHKLGIALIFAVLSLQAQPSMTMLHHHGATTSTNSPSSTNLFMWQSGDELANISRDKIQTWLDITATSGDKIQAWLDLTANSNDWWQISGSVSYRPVYYTNMISGKPALRFDPTTGFTQYFINNNIWSNLTSCELYVVMRSLDYPGIATNGYGGTWRFNTVDPNFQVYTDGKIYDGTFAESRKAVGVTNSFTAPSVITNWHLVDILSATNSWFMWINGNIIATNSICTFTAPTFQEQLGEDSSYATAFHGDIAEILLYSAPRTTAQRAYDVNYLHTKYPGQAF